jgi:hypothetical protein
MYTRGNSYNCRYFETFSRYNQQLHAIEHKDKDATLLSTHVHEDLLHCVHSRIQCKAPKKPRRTKKQGYTPKEKKHDIPSKTDMSRLERRAEKERDHSIVQGEEK